MGMPPPPPRFDGTVAKADDGGKRAMPPPPPLFSAHRKTEGAEKQDGDLAPPPRAEPRAEPPADASRPPAGGYEVPEWGGPSSADFSLEVLKDGAIVDVVDCRGRGCVTLGRTPDNDVVLEHPSSSRTHAVIQFARGAAEAFVFDNGSTHGTFVNKRRLKARVHAPVFVGDQIRFGQSSRVFVVSGAAELMPEEGLSRDERRRLRALETMSEAERTKEHAERAELEKRDDATAGRRDVNWGMGDEDDAPSESEAALRLAALDWRDHAGALTEKQEKQKEKIRRKEEKVRALRLESERISAKESDSTPLTQGQRVTLARNESAVEKLEEEIEDADEALNESIRASVAGGAGARGAKKKSRPRDALGSDSEDAYGSDSDDDFYDRTASAAERRRKKAQNAQAAKAEKHKHARDGSRKEASAAPVAVETAATLWEKKRVAAAALEASRRALAACEAKALGGATSSPEKEEKGKDTEKADDLDAFMASVARARDVEATASASRRVAEAETELKRLDRLLRLADPRGEFAPGSDMQRSVERLAEAARARAAAEEQSAARRAAAEAEARARRAEQEKERARLAEWEKRGELTAKRAFVGSSRGASSGERESAAAPSSVDQASAAANAALPVGMSTAQERRKRAGPPKAAESAAAESLAAEAEAKPSDPAARAVPSAADEDGFLAPEQLRAAHVASTRGSSVLEIRAPKRRRGDDAARGSVASEAEARVADDVLRLMGGGGGFDAGDGDGDGDVADATGFTVPEGQSGDGRTSLNDKLGY
jgi:hypothetical protein